MAKPIMQMFAVTAPGLEPVCAGELQGSGLPGVRIEAGGVAFEGGLAELYRANLWLRSAGRVLVRLGEFRCRDFPELYRKALRLPWGRFIRPGTPVRLRVTSHASRLMHTDRIAATLQEALQRVLNALPAAEGDPQLLVVRLDQDVCQVSVDSSGELLHRRGYREAIGAAPLRETLAAGALLRLGWDGRCPLVDPMCGSGTLVIEGALLARQRAPGLLRSFAFMSWPHFRPGLWGALTDGARRGERTGQDLPLLLGRDQDGEVLAAARSNAERAGVGELLCWQQAAIEQGGAVAGPGLVICNPPYGARLGDPAGLTALYQQLGQAYRRDFKGWRGALLCPGGSLLAATGLPWRQLERLNNGGIEIGLYQTEL